MALSWESIRSQIRASAPISRQRQIFLQSAAIEGRGGCGSGFLDRAPDGGDRLGERDIGGRLLLEDKTFFDPRYRIEHHAGVGIAVALGILAEEPAPPRGLHERLADRLIILLVRQRCASGDRR
jgi:hypothetical protein